MKLKNLELTKESADTNFDRRLEEYERQQYIKKIMNEIKLMNIEEIKFYINQICRL